MEIISHRNLPANRRQKTTQLTRVKRTCSHPSPRINARLLDIIRDLDTEDVRFAYGAGHIRDSLRNVKTGERIEMATPFCDMSQSDLRRVMTRLAR